MKNEALEEIIMEEIRNANDITKGKIKVQREFIAPAKQFLEDIKCFYSNEKNENCLNRIKEYITEPYQLIAANKKDIEERYKKDAKKEIYNCAVMSACSALSTMAAINFNEWFAIGALGFGIGALNNAINAWAITRRYKMMLPVANILMEAKETIINASLENYANVLLSKKEEIKPYLEN